MKAHLVSPSGALGGMVTFAVSPQPDGSVLVRVADRTVIVNSVAWRSAVEPTLERPEPAPVSEPEIDLYDDASQLATEREQVWARLRDIDESLRILWEYAGIDPARRPTLF